METNNEKKVVETREYSYMLFKVVPLNHALIRKNVFTGNVDWVERGFRINPITVNKLVDLADRTVDYENKSYRVVDGFDVTIDPAVTYKIVDPVKFEFKGEDPVALLKIKVESMLRKLCAKFTYDQLVQLRIVLNNPAFSAVKAEFKDLEEKYGLEVMDIILKSVEQSQTLKDDYEKSAAQRRENERKISQAEADAKVAKLEAEKLRVLHDVERRRVVELIRDLVKEGIDEKTAMELVLYGSGNGNAELKRISFDGLNGRNGSMVENGAMFETGASSVRQQNEGPSKTLKK